METKTEWIHYVPNFIANNLEIPMELYGKWTDLVKGTKKIRLENTNPSKTRTNQEKLQQPANLISLDDD